MPLELSQLHALQTSTTGGIEIGRLPPAVASYLGCPLGIAYLSGDSLRHILEEHPDISLFDMLCLPMMITDGLWIGERPKAACVVYTEPWTGKRFIGAIKAVAAGYETYWTTFHLCRPRQTASLLRRGAILQPHK